jgi:hypothetical protein
LLLVPRNLSLRSFLLSPSPFSAAAAMWNATPSRARTSAAGRQAGRQRKWTEKTCLPSAHNSSDSDEGKGSSRGERTFTRGHVHALFHDALETAFTWDPLTTQCLTDACHSMIFCYYCFLLVPFLFFNYISILFFCPLFFQKSFALIRGSLSQLRKGCCNFIYVFIIIFSILWCCSSGIPPWVYLAKFGNIQNMKIIKS